MKQKLHLAKGLGTKSALVVGISLLGGVISAWGAETMTVQPHTFNMPAGDQGVWIANQVKKLSPAPRIPIGAGRLAAIKALASKYPKHEAVTITDAPAAGPSTNGVTGSCTLNSAVGFTPSDVTGAAGPTRLVEATNIEVGVYNGCTLVSKVPLKTFFGATDAGETDFDPQVLYDRRTGRFFITAETETTTSPGTDQFQYLAVSKDSTASSWWIYTITLSSGATKFCKSATTDFWDYPHAGASSTRWFFTANVFPAAGGASGAILSVDKVPSLTGGGITVKCFAGLPFNLAAPIVLDLSTTSNFLSPGSGSGSSIVSRVVNATGAASGTDTLTTGPSYTIPAWTAAPAAPQPGSTATLDTLDGRFQSQSLQSRGFIWNIHAENNSGRSAIRWFELATASGTVIHNPIFQTSAIDDLFNPSITTGSGLQGAPGFINASRTIPSTPTTGNPAMVVFYGLNNDATAANWTASLVGTSTTVYSGCNPCRWGDYSTVTVDPTNSGTAWAFNQLVTGTSEFNWTTKVAKFNLNLLFAPTAANAD